ncbi:DUF4405 domain-containing protein [Piscinibacter terrae]|uniref:DUF4405 domain-containing protein n=1 Tax=Piscinibacter terrae TaxID=2496871 RepID=UPI000F5B0F86|nr:DUF4405 domain-containing protein [Albitalea terrae]
MTRHVPRSHRHHGLPRWQRALLYASGLVLLATGVAWLWLHYTVGAGAGELPHPLEAWSMKLHGLAAFFGLFLLGALAGAHIPQGWRMSGRHRWAQQRGTGIALAAAGGTLALTGYLLYYFAPESVRPALGWIHAAVGIAMTAAILVHRRTRSRHPRD